MRIVIAAAALFATFFGLLYLAVNNPIAAVLAAPFVVSALVLLGVSVPVGRPTRHRLRVT